MYYFIGPYSNY